MTHRWILVAWALSGCGLLLDPDPPVRLDGAPDSGAGDSGQRPDAGLPDAALRPECLQQAFDFEMVDTFPGTYFDSARCEPVAFSFAGDPAEDAPRIQPTFLSGEAGLFLAAAGGRFIEFTWTFPSTVAELNLAFEFLSFDVSRNFDERLEVVLDGVGAAPSLQIVSDVFVAGNEVRASSSQGHGILTVRDFRTFTLRLRNQTSTNGRGIDIPSIDYRYAPP